MCGKRVYADEHGRFAGTRNEGEYARNERGEWYARPPGWNGAPACLRHHTVVEHDDGTITVSPSILLTRSTELDGENLQWHGYLEHGVWRELS